MKHLREFKSWQPHCDIDLLVSSIVNCGTDFYKNFKNVSIKVEEEQESDVNYQIAIQQTDNTPINIYFLILNNDGNTYTMFYIRLICDFNIKFRIFHLQNFNRAKLLRANREFCDYITIDNKNISWEGGSEYYIDNMTGFIKDLEELKQKKEAEKFGL